MKSLALLLAASSLLCAAAAADAVDWARLEPELLRNFEALIRIDSSNPPGNETRVATAIQAILQREGIPSALFSLDPARANLVARIRGAGSKRPILILGHTDVVGVERAKWTVPPFSAFRKSGFIYGRGTVDDKEHVLAGMMILVLLHRLRVPLARDVIFLAEAGEEGSTKFGIDFMVEHHWPEIDAEYALAEGGSIVKDGGKVDHVLITTTEKVPRGVRLVAHGPAGHGSRPVVNNAVVHLAAAVARAGEWQTPLRLNATTRAYFDRLAAISPAQEAARYRAILDPAHAAEADAYFREHEPGHYSILRTSVVPTILRGGFRSNVIPSEAEASLDVRALPDENMDRFLSELRDVIHDPAVEVIPPGTGGRPAATPSRLDTEMYRTLESVARRMFDAPTLPGMLTGATDNAQLRARGVQAYGVGPATSAGAGPLGGAHADDERIPERAVREMVEYLWNVVVEVAGRSEVVP